MLKPGDFPDSLSWSPHGRFKGFIVGRGRLPRRASHGRPMTYLKGLLWAADVYLSGPLMVAQWPI